MAGLDIPSGNQIWADTDLKEEYSCVGQRGVVRKDGYDKASGKAVFTRDVKLPGMLYARYLTSPYANARIVSMDTSAAEAYPGVRYVLRYDDPEIAGLELSTYAMPVWYLGDRAYYWGQTVGVVVAADTEQIADEAISLIDVVWEELPFILDQEESAEEGATLVDERRASNSVPFGYGSPIHQSGDVEAGFAEADGTVDFTGKRDSIPVARQSLLAVWLNGRVSWRCGFRPSAQVLGDSK